jgi:hypothetical protein
MMLSIELRARIRRAVERAHERELNFQRVLPVMNCRRDVHPKPRIRVRANSYRWMLPDASELPMPLK